MAQRGEITSPRAPKEGVPGSKKKTPMRVMGDQVLGTYPKPEEPIKRKALISSVTSSVSFYLSEPQFLYL